MNIQSLIDNLSHPDELERIYASEDIGYANDGSGIAPLVQRLQVESSRAVKLAIFQALSRMADPGVIPAVVELFRSEDSLVRNEAVEMLRQRAEAALPALTEAFRDPDKDVRKFALDALSGLASPKADGLYSQALKDPDINVIIAAIEYIGRQHRIVLRGEIEKLFLQATNTMLITVCLEAFGQIGDSKCLSAVKAKFPDMKQLPRFHWATYIRMLGDVGGPNEYAVLLEQLRMDGKLWTDQAMMAMVAIHSRHPKTFVSEKALPSLYSLVNDSNSAMLKHQALVLIGCLPPSQEAFLILSGRLDSSERLERLGAIEGLSHSRHPKAKFCLSTHQEEDEEILNTLRFVLERMGA